MTSAMAARVCAAAALAIVALSPAAKSNFPLDVGTPEQTRKLYTDQRVFLTSYRHLLKAQ